MNRWLASVHPTPEPDKTDTSLRYTDILFGFVIRELFLRLQHSPNLPWILRWQLIAATVLVLGSWIGFRRSVNRPAYVVKFFNLPFFRFLLDQLMLILYFRVATLIPDVAGSKQTLPPGDAVTKDTSFLIMVIFALYVLWDLLGMWAAAARDPHDRTAKLYPKVEFDPAQGKSVKTTNTQSPDVAGFCISLCFFFVFLYLWWIANCLIPIAALVAMTLLLLLYRWIKEVRTTWRDLRPATP